MISLDQWAVIHGIAPEALEDLRRMMRTDTPVTEADHPPLSEGAAQQQVRLEAPRRGTALWRNNNGAYSDETGRQVRYGLANDSKAMNKKIKSSDLIGVTSILILPSHVGMTIGVFTSIEMKPSGWVYKGTPREVAQEKWLQLVISLGGYAQFATGPDDLWGNSV